MSLFSRPSVFTKSENCPSEVPPTAGRRGTLSPEPPLSATFNEAILASSSSVRDSLPEQHREHFETLRQEIIAFAKAHDIPRDTLNKPDALREAASKLSTPDLTQLANLFERFEHLLVKKEPWKNKEALEYAEKFYHLKEQYDSQFTLLEQVGILRDGTITGIDGKKYPIPTLEQIASRLFERRETLETKHDQGFTKLLLVPFGMSLDVLTETLKQFLLKYKKDNPTFNLNTNQPLWTWEEYQGADIGDSPKLVYEPRSFDEKDHQGKTKMEILEGQETPGQARGDNGRTGNDDRTGDNGWRGWTIHLLQPSNLESQDTETPKGFAYIPRKGKGTPQGDENPRPPLESGKTPMEYLFTLQEAQDDPHSPYFQESGMTPEDWIIAFMIHLTETRKPMDNYANNTENISYLTGVFFHSSVRVSGAYWDHDGRQVCLYGRDPCVRNMHMGTRFSVVV